MFSSTVSERKMLRSCGTQPIPARARWSGRRAVISSPPSATVPPKRRVMPTIELISVVLPVPLRPSSASTWPSPSASDMPDSTTASPYPARKPLMARSSDIDGLLAEIDRLDLGIARHLVRRAFDQHGTVDQHRNPVGKGEHQIHIVLDQQYRDVARQGGDGRQNIVALALGHAGGGLIQQQHA